MWGNTFLDPFAAFVWPVDADRTLIRHGFAPTGKDYLTSSITGEPIEAYIFCRPAPVSAGGD